MPLKSCWATAGLEARPWGQTLHSNCPKHVEKAVSQESSSRVRTWKKRSLQSNVEKIAESPSRLTMLDHAGGGKYCVFNASFTAR